MWLSRIVVSLGLAGSLTGQGLRLGDKIDRPLIYLAQRAPERDGGDVLSVLGDPILRQVLGWQDSGRETRVPSSGGARDARNEVGTGGAALQRLQVLLTRLSVSSELAMVGFVPAPGRQRPLLVFHSQLSEDGAAQLAKMVSGGQMVKPSRKVHGRQVYRLTRDAAAVDVEVVLHGRDLLVSNDPKTLDEVLAPGTRASGGLERDKRYKELRRQVEVPPGSLLCYVDLDSNSATLRQIVHAGMGAVLSSAGVDEADQMLVVARPQPAKKRAGQLPGIATTAVIRHKPQRRPRQVRLPGSAAPGGWLQDLRPLAPQKLLSDVAQGGMLSLSFAIDPEQLLRTRASRRNRWVQARIFRHAVRAGLDLKSQVLRRLASSASLQVVVLPGAEEARTAWSLRARSDRDARAIFRSLRQALIPRGMAQIAADEPGFLRLRYDGHNSTWGVGVVADRLVFARDASLLGLLAAADEPRRSRRTADHLRGQLRRLSGRWRKAHGLMVVDLRQLGARLSGKKNDQSPAQAVDPHRGLFGTHLGLFSLEKDFLRVELVSQLRGS